MSSLVARRYAEAAFAVAREDKDYDGWRREMALLAELFADEVLAAAFSNPAVSATRRLELARQLAPEVRPETFNLMRLLIEHQRTTQMPAIREEFDRLVDEAQGIVHVMLTAATQVSAEDERRYRQALAQKIGRDIRLRVQVDPSLIGGATIQVGDHLVDGSIRTRLEQLRRVLAG
jgi:F-type H+-transporting ATPase subunit delta